MDRREYSPWSPPLRAAEYLSLPCSYRFGLEGQRWRGVVVDEGTTSFDLNGEQSNADLWEREYIGLVRGVRRSR